MAQLISVLLTGDGGTIIANGQVADSAGNLWDLPVSVTIPSVAKATVTATANAQNPAAVFPGSNQPLAIETPVAGWNGAATPAQITPVELRTNFPEFGSSQNFPDAQLNYWITWAYVLLNKNRWGSSLDQAAQLFAAHNLTQERRAFLEAAKNAPPGMAIGPASSKTVDKVSVTYDIAAVSEKGAGDWNQTIYGRRLWRMIQMFGMGPIQAGVGFTPIWAWGGVIGGAWPGPPNWPGAPGGGN